MVKEDFRLKYKEKSPEDTFNFIKGILEELNIEMVEQWFPESEIGTYSLRITIKGAPSIGTNGKGTNKEYARASAYAEFLERLQNLWLTLPYLICSMLARKNYSFKLFPHEKILSVEELLGDNSSFIQWYLRSRGVLTASDEEKKKSLLMNQKTDYYLFKQFNKFLCVPFYSVKQKKVQYLPYYLYMMFYGSNGMSAGNTSEEALVQAISEIYERIANMRILLEKTSLPNIPDEHIMKFPEIYKMYLRIKNDSNYDIYIKDCSYGGKYPVVGLMLIEKNTGKYGFKLGAHPDESVALERIFTEATQGHKISSFCKKSTLDLSNSIVDEYWNITNSFRTSDSNYPYQILLDKPDYEYTEMPSVIGLTNKELINKMLQSLLNDGYDILINDCSYLGFPTYHVIIPGMSEMYNKSDEILDLNYSQYIMREIINQPDKIGVHNCEYLMNLLFTSENNVMNNTLREFSGLISTYVYKGTETKLDTLYMIAMCYAMMGQFDKASSIMRTFNTISKDRVVEHDKKYFITENYFKGMHQLKDHNEVVKYLLKFYDVELCNYIDNLFSDINKIFILQYPTIDINDDDCLEKYCPEFLVYERIIEKYKTFQEKNKINELILKGKLEAIFT